MNEIRMEVNMILAGDIGGTKTRLGLFDAQNVRPVPLFTREYETAEHRNASTVLSAFVAEAQAGTTVTAACFGVAGPVFGDSADLTNAAFHVDAPAIRQAFGIPRVELLND